jgi:hypothetical protein
MIYWELNAQRISGDIIMPSMSPYENSLHHIVKDILNRDYDYWINIDSDNPPMQNPVNLVFEDRDVIGCPTPVWHWSPEKAGDRPIYWNGYDYVSEEDGYAEHGPPEGLQSVDAVGTGCIVIARRVLEHPKMQHGCFQRSTTSDGRVIKGNDIMFCERARDAGFKIWCHYDFPCRHFSELNLEEVARAHGAMIQNG